MSTETPASTSGSASASDDQAVNGQGVEANGQQAEAQRNDTKPAAAEQQPAGQAEAGSKDQPPQGKPKVPELSRTSETFARLTGKTLDGQPAEDAEKSKGEAAAASAAGGEAGGSKKQGTDDHDEVPESIKGNEKDASAWRDLRKRAKVAKDLEPFAKVGKRLVKSVAAAGIADELKTLNDEALASGLALEASISRIAAGRGTDADQKRVEQAWSRVGKKPPAEVQPFTGDLPDELKDAVELKYLSEADARFLMGTRIAKEQAAKATNQEQQNRQGQQQHQERPPERREPDPEQVQAQVLRLEGIMADSMVESGIPEAELKDHIGERLMPKILASIARTSPGEDAEELWESFDPQQRYELLMATHQAHVLAQQRQAAAGGGGGNGGGKRLGPIHQGSGQRQGSRTGQPGTQDPRGLGATFQRLTGEPFKRR